MRLRKIKNKFIPSFQSLKFRHSKNGVILVTKHSRNPQTTPYKSEFEKAMEAYQKVSSKSEFASRLTNLEPQQKVRVIVLLQVQDSQSLTNKRQ